MARQINLTPQVDLGGARAINLMLSPKFEVRLLQRLRHDNIVSILDLYPPDSPDFEDIYVVQGFMDANPHPYYPR